MFFFLECQLQILSLIFLNCEDSMNVEYFDRKRMVFSETWTPNQAVCNLEIMDQNIG